MTKWKTLEFDDLCHNDLLDHIQIRLKDKFTDQIHEMNSIT